ncbi:MAG: general secretion pathway protein M [Cellvibrionaceae bacterium]|jgi:general secretion pathway protein M
MDKLTSWWLDLEAREQWVVGVGSVIILLGVLLFFVVLPLLSWQQQTREYLQKTKDETSEVRQLVARLKDTGSTVADPDENTNLTTLIDRTLRENGLEMISFRPGNKDDARLRLEDAAYSALVQWLYELEYRHNVTVMDLSLTPSKISGRLMVSLRVRKS